MEPKESAFDALNRNLQRHSDLILALAVVMIIGLMVIRVPPAAMDYFLAANIGVGFTVLLVALYIRDALKLPSFPTILLLSTLFRLALNVSTTRLILLEGDAGDIIETFGQFVVGGNFVVGAVVFLVLVIVQFVVIAKGSERVAEVAARFTLDAMPGKQMSIDADLRNGLIDAAGAKKRRTDLERESKLYGAMDGAMKFVKGDAIAGIIISIVNIIGGLVIGVMQQGMSAGEAAEVYSLLTIGDGLVSQIPALLISVASGLVVTRVAAKDDDGEDDDEPEGLAQEMFEQVAANPKGLAIAAGILAVMGCSQPFTGFPAVPFLGLAGILGAIAYSRLRADAEPAAPGPVVAGAPSGAAAPGSGADAEPAAPQGFAPVDLILDIDPGLQDTFVSSDPATTARINTTLKDQRERRSQDLGIHFPPAAIRITDRKASDLGYTILARDAVIGRGVMSPYNIFALGEADKLSELGYQATPIQRPGWRLEISLLTDLDQAPKAREEGVPLIFADEAIFDHVDRVCRQRADLFLGIQQAAVLIDELREKSPDLVKAVVPTLLNLQQVTSVLKLLLREQVPIRDLAQIFESLAHWGGEHKDPFILSELVRGDLRLMLCSRYAAGGPSIRYYSLDPELERLIQDNAGGRPLNVEERMDLLKAMHRTIDPRRHLAVDPLILVRDRNIRAPLRRLIEDRLPEVAVFAHETTAGFVLQEVGRITLSEPAAV